MVRNPQFEAVGRHCLWTSDLVGWKAHIRPTQVLFKRKLVQYLPQPVIDDDSSEVHQIWQRAKGTNG